MTVLEERLRRAGAQLDRASDDYRVTARRKPERDEARHRRTARRVALVAAAVVAVALVAAGLAIAASTRRTATVRTTDAPALRDAGVAGDLVSSRYGLRSLATGETVALRSPSMVIGDTQLPIGVPGPGGTQLYYTSWTNPPGVDPTAPVPDEGGVIGRPSIRVKDVDGGSDRLVVDGATSVAVDRQGALAFARGTRADARHDAPYTTEVVIRPSGGGADEVWSAAAGRYDVLAWAGERLVVHEGVAGSAGKLIVYDGPRAVRTLATGAELLALSPDGTMALVSPADNDVNNDDPYRLELLDVATGAPAGTVDVGSLGSIASALAASWAGDRVMLTATTAAGAPLVLVFTAASGTGPTRLTLHRSYALDDAHDVPSDVWLTDDGATVAAVGAPRTDSSRPAGTVPFVLTTCPLDARRCSDRDLDETIDTQLLRARNPSRPSPAGLPDEAK